MNNLKCSICHENVYTGVGKGCKLCGMPLEDPSREFCSRICRTGYGKINGEII